MDDYELLQRLVAGDEKAFIDIVTRYHQSLVRVARYYVASESSAEDAAQETWMAVLRGLEKFEGRSSFKTWLFRIVANRARTIGVREHRTIPVDPLAPESSVTVSRFNKGGMWIDPPAPFSDAIDDGIVNAPIIRLVHESIARLPESFRAVVTLRDVEGLSSAEVAEILGLSEANVRVILHRCRSRIRNDVESRVREGES